MGDRDFARLVATAYEAALAPELWPDFARDLVDSAGGTAFNLSVFAPALGAGQLAVAWGLPDEHVAAYRDGYWRHDLWRIAAAEKGIVGHVVAGEAMVPEADLLRSVVYNDVLRRGDFRHICGGLVFHRPWDDAGAGFSLMRTGRQGPFDAHEVHGINRLLPHIGRAIGLSLRVAAAKSRTETLTAAFDRQGAAVLLVDPAGRVIESNDVAERLLHAGTVLRLNDGRLAACSPAGDQALQRLMRRAYDPGASAAETAAITLERASPWPPLRIKALPLRQRRHRLAPLLLELLIVIDNAEPQAPPPVQQVARAHGLTVAETALLAALIDGATLIEFAERRGISVHTARNQLKSVFQKTGTRRQTELLRLALGRNDGEFSAS